MLVPVSGGESSVESYELVSEPQTDHQADFVDLTEVESDADVFAFVNDELADPEARREKLRMLMTELRSLDDRLMKRESPADATALGAGGALEAGAAALGAGASDVKPELQAVKEEEDDADDQRQQHYGYAAVSGAKLKLV